MDIKHRVHRSTHMVATVINSSLSPPTSPHTWVKWLRVRAGCHTFLPNTAPPSVHGPHSMHQDVTLAISFNLTAPLQADSNATHISQLRSLGSSSGVVSHPPPCTCPHTTRPDFGAGRQRSGLRQSPPVSRNLTYSSRPTASSGHSPAMFLVLAPHLTSRGLVSLHESYCLITSMIIVLFYVCYHQLQ